MSGSKTIDASVPIELRELRLTRVLNALRETVFQAWTDQDQLAQWWGPAGFTNPICEVDARAGGAMRIHMCGHDGSIYPMSGEFKELIRPEGLTFSSAALDSDNRPMFELLNTVHFTEQAGKTTLALHVAVTSASPAAAQYLGGMEPGWSQSLDKLEALLQPSVERTSFAMEPQ